MESAIGDKARDSDRARAPALTASGNRGEGEKAQKHNFSTH
jgi:hypothetical protein